MDRRARAKSAAEKERQARIEHLSADWFVANDQAEAAIAGLYELGLSRAEIAGRLGVPTARIPKNEDLVEVVEEDSSDDIAEAGEDGVRDGGSDNEDKAADPRGEAADGDSPLLGENSA